MTAAVQSHADGQDTASTIARLLREQIIAASNNDPRSLQRAIGPSGVGTPCDRRLAYTLFDWPTTNNESDPLAAIIGKAVHAWLAEAFGILDDYTAEQRVNIRAGLAGSSDLYYKPLCAVLDWKIVGPTAMKKYKKGVGPQYRAQRHLYGMGFINAGLDVRLVGCVFIPRSGRLSDMFVDIERYDPTIAQAALDRMDTVVQLLGALDVEKNPGNWPLIPTADAYCTYCPWFLPGSKDPSKGCPGDPARDVKVTKFEGLV